MNNSMFFSLASLALRVYGVFAETSSHRFIVKGTHPGKNADGYSLDNCYEDGSPGVVSRISRKPEAGREQLPGNYKTRLKGIYAYEEPIGSPAEKWNRIANVIESLEPISRNLLVKLQQKKETKYEALPNKVSIKTYNETPKALPAPSNDAEISERFRTAVNSPFFVNNDSLEKVDTHLQNRNQS